LFFPLVEASALHHSPLTYLQNNMKRRYIILFFLIWYWWRLQALKWTDVKWYYDSNFTYSRTYLGRFLDDSEPNIVFCSLWLYSHLFCRVLHALLIVFVFIYAYWCPIPFPYQIMFVSFNINTTGRGTEANYQRINIMSIWLIKHFETDNGDIWNN
jgi:hypothetical protein